MKKQLHVATLCHAAPRVRNHWSIVCLYYKLVMIEVKVEYQGVYQGFGQAKLQMMTLVSLSGVWLYVYPVKFNTWSKKSLHLKGIVFTVCAINNTKIDLTPETYQRGFWDVSITKALVIKNRDEGGARRGIKKYHKLRDVNDRQSWMRNVPKQLTLPMKLWSRIQRFERWLRQEDCRA